MLKKHWPDVPTHDDVRTLDTDGLVDVDVVVGGFPCQPYSIAGEQRGAEDDRDLWPQMARLIEKLRPRYAICENVRGFVNAPMGLERSLFDLERIGYEAASFIIPAIAVDAPHVRHRVFILAHASGSRLERRKQRGPFSKSSRAPRPITECGKDARPQKWTTEPELGRVGYGFPDRVHRITALGNAVVPQVVTEIAKAIVQAEQ